MVLQRSAGFLDAEYVATAEGQFINCQTPGFDERATARERGERLWSGGRLAGVQRVTTRIIFYFSLFACALHPASAYAHPSLNARASIQGYLTLRWLGRFKRGNNRAGIRSYESCLNELTRTRSVVIRTLSYSSGIIPTILPRQKSNCRLVLIMRRNEATIPFPPFILSTLL